MVGTTGHFSFLMQSRGRPHAHIICENCFHFAGVSILLACCWVATRFCLLSSLSLCLSVSLSSFPPAPWNAMQTPHVSSKPWASLAVSPSCFHYLSSHIIIIINCLLDIHQ